MPIHSIGDIGYEFSGAVGITVFVTGKNAEEKIAVFGKNNAPIMAYALFKAGFM